MKRLLLLLLLLLPADSSAKNKVTFLNVDPRTQHVEVVLDGNPTDDYLDKTKYRLVSLTSSLPGGEWKWISLSEVKINPRGTIVILIPQSTSG